MSEIHKAARIKYWADMPPEIKSKRMSDIAKKRQSKLTFKQRRDIAMKMVAARMANKKRRKEEAEERHRNGMV